MIDPEVLYEDNHCLAVHKPAGLLSQGDRTGEPSLVDVVSLYLKTALCEGWQRLRGAVASAGPAGVGCDVAREDEQSCRTSLGAISCRDDRETLLGDRRRVPPEDSGSWTDIVTKDTRSNCASAHGNKELAGKEASVEFRILERWPFRTKVELKPRSGRSHQLRVQLASRGIPILGDLKYGSKVRLKAAGRAVADRPARPGDHVHAPDSS